MTMSVSTRWSFNHPELKQPWFCMALDKKGATDLFEACWCLRIPEGLLEHVDGNFYDGEVKREKFGAPQTNLCVKSLEGHMEMPDERPERTEFAVAAFKAFDPIVCILCGRTAWDFPKGSEVAD